MLIVTWKVDAEDRWIKYDSTYGTAKLLARYAAVLWESEEEARALVVRFTAGVVVEFSRRVDGAFLHCKPAMRQPESAAPMVASTVLSLATPHSAELSRKSQRRPRQDAATAGPAGAAASEVWSLQDSNGRRTKTSHARCAGNRAPPLLLRRPYLASAGLQHSSRSYVEGTLPVWGQVLPQEPGALAPTTCARPSRVGFDWSSSLASPRVAGASRAVLASAQSMRADRRAAS